MSESKTLPTSQASEVDQPIKWKKWREELWASKESRRASKAPENLIPRWHDALWEQKRENYQKDPQGFICDTSKELESELKKIESSIDKKWAVSSKNTESYARLTADDVQKINAMQELVNELILRMRHINYELSETPPQLLVHTYSSYHPDAFLKLPSASVLFPRYVDLNSAGFDYFKNNLEQFKAVMAHEFAHIYNGDLSVEKLAICSINPPDHSEEVLANRMGAIIHGNPKAYAREMFEYSQYCLNLDDRGNDKYYSTHPSYAAQAYMLHRWAEILQKHSATDEHGNIIIEKQQDGREVPTKALEMFDISKEIADSLVSNDRKTKGITLIRSLSR